MNKRKKKIFHAHILKNKSNMVYVQQYKKSIKPKNNYKYSIRIIINKEKLKV